MVHKIFFFFLAPSVRCAKCFCLPSSAKLLDYFASLHVRRAMSCAHELCGARGDMPRPANLDASGLLRCQTCRLVTGPPLAGGVAETAVDVAAVSVPRWLLLPCPWRGRLFCTSRTRFYTQFCCILSVACILQSVSRVRAFDCRNNVDSRLVFNGVRGRCSSMSLLLSSKAS